MLKLFIIVSKDITTYHIQQALSHHSLIPTTILSGGTHNYRAVEEYGRNNSIPIEKYSPLPSKTHSWKVRCQKRLHTIVGVADGVLLIVGKEDSPSMDYVYTLVSSPTYNNKPFYLFGV